MITKKKLGTDTTAADYYEIATLSEGERYSGPALPFEAEDHASEVSSAFESAVAPLSKLH